ncbi:MAG: hypothetical protein NTY07_02630 [Bacteroidia bacterium]|nr:hypothetical protein [Bacteroidia bacterium]
MKRLFYILIFLGVIILFHACEKEKMNSSSDSVLHFSSDTVTFDTLFTSIGSPTKNLRVINQTNENIVISSVRLAGGKQSGFRLNVNGEASNETYNVQIPARDSIFIFVEAILEKTGKNIPLVTEDSIIFRINNVEQKVRLMAWGQDFVLIKSDKIKTSVWNKERPYLVYNEALVDSGQMLTIESGTTVYFHKNAGLKVKGTLKISGTFEEPVVFKGDRLEPAFNDIPDQWNGIILYSGSHNNRINYAIIKNANIGLQVGTIEHSGYASVELSNTRIENMSWSGIWAMKSKILAYNCVISNVRYYNTALLLGGDYQFYHTTFANYYNKLSSGMRTTETLIVSNYLVDIKSGVRYVGDLKEATFGNCIITGNRVNELLISMDKQGGSNYLFDRSLIQISDTFKLAESSRFVDIIRNVNPRFKNPYKGNFELDTLSIVKDYGKTTYGKLYPLDLKYDSRISDEGPDLGAFERIEKKNGTKK